MDRDDTWETTVDLTGEDGMRLSADTKVELLEGAEDETGYRLTISGNEWIDPGRVLREHPTLRPRRVNGEGVPNPA